MPESPQTDRPALPRIRAARPADADGIAVMSKLLGLDGQTADGAYQSVPDRAERLRQLLAGSRHAGWVADDAGLVGFVWVHHTGSREAVVREMYVMPPYRRLGVGRALVGEVVRAHVAWELSVNTLAQDPRAVGFWTAMGFAPYWLTLRRPRR